MSRRLTHTAAVTLAAFSFGLGTAACGGDGPSDEERAAEQRAQARWQAGVPQWRAEMLQALNEISLMLSNASTVGKLQGGNPKTTAQLGGFEQTLEGCSASIKRIGLAPGALADVRREALRTCRSLERGARLVHAGVVDGLSGRGTREINRANVALGNGQHLIERVRSTLETALGE